MTDEKDIETVPFDRNNLPEDAFIVVFSPKTGMEMLIPDTISDDEQLSVGGAALIGCYDRLVTDEKFRDDMVQRAIQLFSGPESKENGESIEG